MLILFTGLIINTKKENPVIIKNNINIKIPLNESFANACTLIKTPDLTRNVPSKLNEKHSIERKTIHLLSCELWYTT